MTKCPHGFDHPLPPTYPPEPAARRDSVKTRIILDSSECPDCLRYHVAAAELLLNRVFTNRGIINAETYAMWIDYVQRYNP